MKSNKKELIAEINSEKLKLNNTLQELSDIQRNSFGTFDEWAPKDFLTHLYSWEILFLDWYQNLDAANLQAPAKGYKWDNYYSLNLHIFESNKNVSFEDAHIEYVKQSQITLSYAEKFNNDEWFGDHLIPWYGKTTPFAEPLWEVTGNHYLWANTEIQTWKNRNI